MPVRYKFLLFDVDDTLLDFHKAEEESFFATMNIFGVEADMQMLNTYTVINKACWEELQQNKITQKELGIKRFKELFANYKIDLNPDKVNESFLKILSEKALLFPDTYKVCSTLSKTHSLYMITNSVASVHRRRMENCAIKEFFKDMFISGELGHIKPSIEFFNEVSGRIEGFDKKEALVIGDSPTSDLLGANIYGIDCCYVDRRGVPLPQDVKASYVVNDLYGLYDIV